MRRPTAIHLSQRLQPSSSQSLGQRLSRTRARALGVVLLWLASCGHPCRDLSDAVCRCAQTAEQEAQCIRQVRALASQDGGHDAASERQCRALLETCTCERLAAGDLAACGLATQAR